MSIDMIDDLYIYYEDTAYQNGELAIYYENRKLNIACAKAVDKVIYSSNTGENHYNMRTAVTTVIAEYGTARLLWILANIVQYNGSDGRFSRDNKDWAMALTVPKDAPFCKFAVQTHSAVLDMFIRTAREICDILHSEYEMVIIKTMDWLLMVFMKVSLLSKFRLADKNKNMA